jgi:SAM-dependent methyltransferase
MIQDVREPAYKFYSVRDSTRDYYLKNLRSVCSGKRILELGCERGGDVLPLGELASHATGIDVSDRVIEEAKVKAAASGCNTVSYAVMDCEHLQFEDDSFDVVFGGGILHHLDLTKALPEIARTLTPNGWAIFEEPLGHNPIINLYRKLTPDFRSPDEHPLLARDLDFAASFFAKTDERYFNLSTFLAVPFRKTRLFKQMLKILNDFDAFLFRYLPFTRKLAWEVIAIYSEPKKIRVTTQAHSTTADPLPTA